MCKFAFLSAFSDSHNNNKSLCEKRDKEREREVSEREKQFYRLQRLNITRKKGRRLAKHLERGEGIIKKMNKVGIKENEGEQ